MSSYTLCTIFPIPISSNVVLLSLGKIIFKNSGRNRMKGFELKYTDLVHKMLMSQNTFKVNNYIPGPSGY